MRRAKEVAGSLALVLALAACTAGHGNNQNPPPTVSASPTAPASRPAPEPTLGPRDLTVVVETGNWPGALGTGLKVSDSTLATNLLKVLNAKGGWADADVRFVAGNIGARIRVVLFNQNTIHDLSLDGCEQPALACAGNDDGVPPFCTVNLDYRISTSGKLRYFMAGTGIILHEFGHCFFGDAHRPGDRLMKPRLSPYEQVHARPSAKMLAELRRRPDDQLIGPSTPTTG